MTHGVAALIHHLANQGHNRFVTLYGAPDLCAAMPVARENGLIEHPSDDPLDRYHARLTIDGWRVASEMIAAAEMFGQ